MVYYLLQWAQAQGKLGELVVAVQNENPGNPALRDFAESNKLAAAQNIEYAGQLEQIVLKSVHFNNAVAWRTCMSERELTVCRVEVGGGSFGTGFLLGPSVVMTNYHVVKDVIKNPALCTHVKLRFDYKTYADGTTLNEGQVFRLFGDANWLLRITVQLMIWITRC